VPDLVLDDAEEVDPVRRREVVEPVIPAGGLKPVVPICELNWAEMSALTTLRSEPASLLASAWM
jgi:hypothetical protein